MKRTVLIIDDDQELNELLTEYLGQFDFRVLTASRPALGLKLLREEAPNLIVLDVMLPEKSGLDLCKEIRSETRTPIIMLTARGDLSDRVIGLELGADDYMSKPYEPRELVARIQSVLRRTGRPLTQNAATLLVSHELKLNLSHASAFLNDELLDLTSTEFEILKLLMRNPGVTLSRDQIMDQLRGIPWDAMDRTVDVLVSRLRHKLKEDSKNPHYLKTMWGIGYRFVGEVQELDAL